MGFDFQAMDVFLVFLGIALETAIILSVTLLFSTFSASFLTIIFTLCFFVIGHWSETLMQLMATRRDDEFGWIVRLAYRGLPNLELFNWRLQPVEPFLQIPFVLQSMAVAGAWSVFFLFASALIFGKRDFA
jgi:hypothetical protein